MFSLFFQRKINPTRCFSSVTERAQHVIASFRDLEPFIKKIVLRVHPDVINRYPEHIKRENQRSLSEFMVLVDRIKQFATPLHDKDESKTSHAHRTAMNERLNQLYRFQFHYERQRGAEQATMASLNQLKYKFIIPSDLLRQSNAITTKKLTSEQMAIQWLELGRRMVNDMLGQLEINTELMLDKKLSETEAQRSYKANKHRRPRFAKENGAEEIMLQNLMDASPIVQGKTHGYQDISMFQASIFSAKERNMAVGRILKHCFSGYLGISNEQQRLGISRLSDAMMRYFDALQLFDGVWGNIRIVLSVSFAYVQETHTFYIPYNFTDRKFVELFQQHIPEIQTELRTRPGKYNAKRAAAAYQSPTTHSRASSHASSTAGTTGTMHDIHYAHLAEEELPNDFDPQTQAEETMQSKDKVSDFVRRVQSLNFAR